MQVPQGGQLTCVHTLAINLFGQCHLQVCMLALYGDRDPLKKDMAILSKVFKHAYQVRA